MEIRDSVSFFLKPKNESERKTISVRAKFKVSYGSVALLFLRVKLCKEA
jgi:hypothetical protein